jgi:hypothetical protein
MIPKTLFYIISVILLLGWLLGFFLFRITSAMMHLMPVLALAALLTGLLGKNSSE